MILRLVDFHSLHSESRNPHVLKLPWNTGFPLCHLEENKPFVSVCVHMCSLDGTEKGGNLSRQLLPLSTSFFLPTAHIIFKHLDHIKPGLQPQEFKLAAGTPDSAFSDVGQEEGGNTLHLRKGFKIRAS